MVLSHPQASAQCARFVRTELPQAEVRAAASTADAVREVAGSERPWAALAGRGAAAIYSCVVLREAVDDEAGNVTRFVWLAPEGVEPQGDGPWRTTLAFSELGADHPGALIEALTEFSDRAVNLTRIESRPLRQGLGRYMFFIDVEGGSADRGRRGDRGAARQGRERPRARQLPGCRRRGARRLTARAGPRAALSFRGHGGPR